MCCVCVSSQAHFRYSSRSDLYMKAGHRSAVFAWYVAGSLLLLLLCCYCFCCCYSFRNHHAVFSTSTTANSRLWYFRRGPNVGQARQKLEVVREGVQGESWTMATPSAAAGAALELSRPIAEKSLPPGRGLRVHSMSDLHTDSKDNAAW